ncbi:DNA-binding protein H-NS [Pararobbsia alpina]
MAHHSVRTMNSIKDLIAERQRLDDLLDEARRGEKDRALKDIAELAAAHGITIVEIASALGHGPKKTGRTDLPAAYYDPITGRSWTGRGRTPWWLEGKALDDYRIHVPGQPA